MRELIESAEKSARPRPPEQFRATIYDYTNQRKLRATGAIVAPRRLVVEESSRRSGSWRGAASSSVRSPRARWFRTRRCLPWSVWSGATGGLSARWRWGCCRKRARARSPVRGSRSASPAGLPHPRERTARVLSSLRRLPGQAAAIPGACSNSERQVRRRRLRAVSGLAEPRGHAPGERNRCSVRLPAVLESGHHDSRYGQRPRQLPRCRALRPRSGSGARIRNGGRMVSLHQPIEAPHRRHDPTAIWIFRRVKLVRVQRASPPFILAS